jgi:transposase-like protein
MKHDREFWTRHVKARRASGLPQAQYCRRHGLVKGTLGYWASTVNKSKASGSEPVEVGQVIPASASSTPVSHRRRHRDEEGSLTLCLTLR